MQWMYFLSTINLLTSHTNQPLLHTLGGCLEKKIGPIRSQSMWETINKWKGNCILLFVQFF